MGSNLKMVWVREKRLHCLEIILLIINKDEVKSFNFGEFFLTEHNTKKFRMKVFRIQILVCYFASKLERLIKNRTHVSTGHYSI